METSLRLIIRNDFCPRSFLETGNPRLAETAILRAIQSLARIIMIISGIAAVTTRIHYQNEMHAQRDPACNDVIMRAAARAR